MNKVSDKEFEIYKKAVEHWLSFFGLLDWCPDFQQIDLLKDDTMARVLITFQSRCATFLLTTKYKTEMPKRIKRDFRRYAFHEVCELLLITIVTWAEHSKAEDMVVEETHRIIRLLENSVFNTLDREE